MASQDKGITLITLAITIIVLVILTGVTINIGYGTYREMLLTSYVTKMNMVQARVNVIGQKVSDGDTSYDSIGIPISELTTSQKDKINSILGGAPNDDFKYYNEAELAKLGVEKIDEDVIINLSTRIIYSMLGIQYEGAMYYNQYNLPNGTQVIEYRELQTSAPEFTLEKENYGLTTTVNITNIIYDEQISGSDIYYGEVTDSTTNPVTVKFWKQVNGTSFSVTKTATYAVKMIDRNGGQTIKTVNVVTCNAPELTTGMVPVIYEDGKWKKVADNEMGKWYDYSEKKWANIMLSDDLEIADDGTITTMGSMFVWIPRYAYQVIPKEENETRGSINVKFLKNTTYLTTDETTTKMENVSGTGDWTVHPAFMDGSQNDYAQGGWDRELEGFWVAKFEASGVDNGVAVGVEEESTSTTSVVRVVPGVQSWRYITIGEAQYKSMQMKSNEKYGWTSGAVDSHLIKNDEWGAVAYLCYSKYGNVPMTNGSNNYYTGAGPYTNTREDGTYTYTAEHAYNTDNGVLASTTGNVYGIYDMAGGNWERVAGYLNNGNVSLGDYGKSTTDINVKYFTKDEEKSTSQYDFYDIVDASNNQKYWNKYEVGEEEKTNKITIEMSDGTKKTLTQKELWNANYNTSEYNVARLRITRENYENMKAIKGIEEGLSSIFSYFGVNSSGSWDWYTDATATTVNFGKTWDNDIVLIGHGRALFIERGGYFGNKIDAGILSLRFNIGHLGYGDGFRTTLVIE